MSVLAKRSSYGVPALLVVQQGGAVAVVQEDALVAAAGLTARLRVAAGVAPEIIHPGDQAPTHLP